METKTKTPKSSKTATAASAPPTTPAPTPAPKPVASPSKVEDQPVQPSANQAPEEFVNEKFDYVNNKIVEMTTTLKTLQNFVKVLQKDLAKVLKSSKRGKAKGGSNGGAKKTPSGFAKPTKLSNALCDFLAVPKGTEMARTDVTRLLNEYIKSKNLQDKEDKRTIHPDAKLQTILTLESDDTLTFFNLQKYIKHNFVKAVAA
jgi:chromatin remodeling complex protein RSC6